MKSRVTNLYDYHQYRPPEELRRWRVPDNQIDDRLDLLSRNHSLQADVDSVQEKDSVACRGESTVPRWNQPVLFFYPGYGLCEVEDALLGMKVGESKTVSTTEGEITLTVLRILRRVNHPVDDALVQLESIEGVQTLEDYRRWYRETTEDKNREEQPIRMAYGLQNAIEENSACDIDPEEESRCVREYANQFYDAMTATGQDLTIPEDGVTFLTEEQAREKVYQQFLPMYRRYVICRAIMEEIGHMDYETAFQVGLKEAAESHGNQPEDLLAQGRTWNIEEYAMEFGAIRVLAELCKQYLEG